MIQDSIQATLTRLLEETLSSIGFAGATISLEHPADVTHGDYSTNVALATYRTLAVATDSHVPGGEKHDGIIWAQIAKNPKELAEKIVAALSKTSIPEIEKITVAGPGFINFHLARTFFTEQIRAINSRPQDFGKNSTYSGKKVMVEYTQPNPFKPFHIGHLMSNAIGESISRIIEFSGARMVRVNYQGDIGLHVAKAIWGIQKKGMPDELLPVPERANYIGECYSFGAGAYEENPEAKKEIDEINKKIYERSDTDINKVYDWGRKVTLEAFEGIYHTLGTKFDHYFFENTVAPIGALLVRDYLAKGIFEESEGAIVFHAEKYDPKLHTRVFITKLGIPTYEAKELGLTKMKFEKENPDFSIVTTAVEQKEYMKVVFKAVEQIEPSWAARTKHITHGMMRLTAQAGLASIKMSSRKGNVVTGESLLLDAKEMILQKISDRNFDELRKKEIAEMVGVAALKYSILKSGIGADIVYDFEKSISFEGDSGPYLQYSATRAHSVLEKAAGEGIERGFQEIPAEVFALEKQLYRFPEVVLYALIELEPHHIATYLTLLASEFNAFYANNQIVSKIDKHSPYKIALTQAFYEIMKNGLDLLGIKTPERM